MKASEITGEQIDFLIKLLQKDASPAFEDGKALNVLKVIFEIFVDFEFMLGFGFYGLAIPYDEKGTALINIVEVAGAVGIALDHFNGVLPPSLIKKLQNKPQTTDTMFELSCLGVLRDKNKVIYEPELEGGKVPDFLINSEKFGRIYIECKDQRLQGSTSERAFERVRCAVVGVVNGSSLQNQAWAQDLRCEIRINKPPTISEINNLKCEIEKLTVSDLKKGVEVQNNIMLTAVHKTVPCAKGFWLTGSAITVGSSKPTSLADENAQTVIYSWRSLEVGLRRMQRRLLKVARCKFSNMPNDAWGMICINVTNSKHFIAEVQVALQRPEFSKIPIVWVNPFGKSIVVCRNDVAGIRDELFRNLLLINGDLAN